MKILVYFLTFFLAIIKADISFAQYDHSNQGRVLGIIKDTQTSEPLSYGAVAVIRPSDSSVVASEIADSAGHFTINSIPFGNYYLKISFIGYEIFKTDIFAINEGGMEKNFGYIKLKPMSAVLKAVNIESKQIRMEQKGDTIQYNSDAYKTHPDASAEDLVTKMPGITTDNNGNVTAHGEQVKQVLVDGKPFFGDDPAMALKNLPAEIIDKIQLFDKLSDQAQFTGFDDGQSIKTINIVTKPGKNNGQFGKIYAGYGTDDRYIAGGNANFFQGDRRVSVIGLSNNVNQQNFSTQDLLGVMGGSSGGGRGGRGGGGRSGNGGGGGGDGNQTNNFLVGPQPGISTTNSIGVNYSDKWGNKIKVSGSYFFNNTDNNSSTSLTRNYITDRDSGLNYIEKSQSDSKNFNHRLNFRFEYEIDSSDKIIITPKINLQQNNANSAVLGSNLLPENILESKTNNSSNSDNAGYTLSNSILFQHKFKKRGRTFSWNLSTDSNNKNGKGGLYSLSNYYYINDSTLIDQHSSQNSNGYTISSSINYTEPIDSSSQLQFSYSPSYANNNTDKETNNFDLSNQDYSHLDTVLSNKYQNTYISNRAGISYRRREKKYIFATGFNFQYASLFGSEIFPTAFTVDKSFKDVLPNAMLNYKFSKGTNLRVMYRTSTNTPSISQLQAVINNSNPLLLSTGNPDLKQDYEHTIIVRYGKTKSEKATGLFVFLFGNYAMNYIGNSTLIASKDTLLNNEILLNKGSQLSKPVNLNGYWNTRSLITYALPVSKIKCNLNFNTGFTFTKTPALINDEINLSNTYNFSGGTGLSSNISEKVDFNLSYTANYSIVNNTLQIQSNNNYFYHTASLKFNWIVWKGFVFNTNMIQTLYSGLAQSYNQNYLLCNASVGYKFLNDQSLELKVTVFDIFNQNNSITRNVTETYIEDNQTKVLNRYYMAMLTYSFRNFKRKP